MAQQTAVDFLVSQIINKHRMAVLINNNNEVKLDIPKDLIDVAKAMEKEQMVDATVQYLIKHRGMHSEQSILTAVELSEQYYNKTYSK